MKAAIALFTITAVQVNQVLFRDEHLHIHRELHVQNTTSGSAIVASAERLFRYFVPGAHYLSKCFSTEKAATLDAKSRGYSDIVIEPVDREGRAIPASRISMNNSELLYSGILG